MIKIMLVEDEPPILRDLKGLIESLSDQYIVTACANNGQQAIDLLKTEIPDILFTDIQMPVINGLDLLAHIKHQQLDIIPVILSGYDDFSYAKKAMTLDVVEYLLKPVDQNELQLLMDKLTLTIETKKAVHERNYLSSIINNRTSPDTGTGFFKDTYQIMLFCLGSFPTFTHDYYTNQQLVWDNFNMETLLVKLMPKNNKFWVFDGNTYSEKIVILTFNKPSTVLTRNIASSIYQNLCDHSNYSPTVLVSDYLNDVNNIGSRIKNLRENLYKSTIIGMPQVIYERDGFHHIDSNQNVANVIDTLQKDRLTLYIHQENLSQIKKELKQLFDHWKKTRYRQIWVEKLLKEIVFMFYDSLPATTNVDKAQLELEINEAISVSYSYEHLFKNLWYIFDTISRKDYFINKEAELQKMMEKIDLFIQNNITEPINHQMLSEMYGLVPSYLSKLFRNYKGMSPAEYLLYLRMEKAKALITSDPTLLLKDVSTIVGYSDSLYFSKAFKKYTGYSPSQYKKESEGD